MITLTQSKVIFNSKSHTYTLNGKELKGITRLLKEKLFPTQYKNVPKQVLENAKNYGTLVHNTIDFCDSLGIKDGEKYLSDYWRLKEENNLSTLSNEYLVTDNQYYASMIDVVFNDLSIADIKTTSTLDIEYVSWQLSIYAYLFELCNQTLKVNKLYAIWLPRATTKKPKIVEVERKNTDDILNLLYE